MRRLLSPLAVSSLAAALLVPAARAAPRDALARRHLRVGRPVHAPRAGRDQRPARAAPRRADDARARALERHGRRTRDADRDGARGSADGDRRRRQRRLLRARDRKALGRPDAGRTAASRPPNAGPRERRDHERRPRSTSAVSRSRAPGGARSATRPLDALNALPRRRRRGALHRRVRAERRPRSRGAPPSSSSPSRRRRPTSTSPRRSSRRATDGGAVAIPPGGAVLLARGAAGADARGRGARRRDDRSVHLGLAPVVARTWSARSAEARRSSGTAPPVFRAGEVFTTAQLGPRAPRSAVGQLRDGRIILVAVDGRQPGYSVGLTNFELAQALVRLGAVTGMALDSGGSTTMAFDGHAPQPARPTEASGGSRRRSCSSTAGCSRPSRPRASRRTATASTTTPTCATASSALVGDRDAAGARRVDAASRRRRSSAPGRTPCRSRPSRGRRRGGEHAAAAGTWTFEVKAVDDLGQASSMTADLRRRRHARLPPRAEARARCRPAAARSRSRSGCPAGAGVGHRASDEAGRVVRGGLAVACSARGRRPARRLGRPRAERPRLDGALHGAGRRDVEPRPLGARRADRRSARPPPAVGCPLESDTAALASRDARRRDRHRRHDLGHRRRSATTASTPSSC